MYRDYIIIESLKDRGAQGECAIVKFVDDEKNHFLKKMKSEDQEKSERRRRFFRETKILELVQNNIDGIAKIVQTNAGEYENKAIELYYISEYIEGQTLREFVEKQKPDETTIIALLKELLIIVKNCHSEGILHRDIKPDNIIISHNNKVFLVDFGIGYIATGSETTKDITHNGNKLGNSFLFLPELHSFSEDKRDPRSDLAFVCGIAFFMLFRKNPRTIAGYGKYEQPHHNPEIKNKLTNLRFKFHWKRIFDIGFCFGLADRWQSADYLLEVLDSMSDEKLEEIKNDTNFLKEYSDQINLEKIRNISTTLQKKGDILKITCNKIINQFTAFRTEVETWVCNLGDLQSKHQIRVYTKDGSKGKRHVAFNCIVKYNGESFIGYLEHNSVLHPIFSSSTEHTLDEGLIEEILTPHIQTPLVEFIKL